MSDIIPPFLLCLLAGAILLLGYMCGTVDGRTQAQQQAIDRGHAEWRIIPGTSETEFKWKDEQ